MKIGIRLPQTGEEYATKENIIHLAETKNAGCFKFLWERVRNNNHCQEIND